MCHRTENELSRRCDAPRERNTHSLFGEYRLSDFELFGWLNHNNPNVSESSGTEFLYLTAYAGNQTLYRT